MYATHIAKLFPQQGKWTEHEYFLLPDSSYIVELSDGEIIMPPHPGDMHQTVSSNLVDRMTRFLEKNDLGIVRYAPLPVRLWEDKIREPDVLFVRKEHFDRRGEQVYGPPDWVAEIISPGTRKTDEQDKLAEYAQAGIPEYWLIDPDNFSVRVYVLPDDGNAYNLSETYYSGDKVMAESIPGFSVPVVDLFAGAAQNS